MDFPTIPENLSAETAEALAALRGALTDFGAKLLEQHNSGEALSAEQMEQARTVRRVVAEIDADLAQREADEADVAALSDLLAEAPEAEAEAEEANGDLSDESDPEGEGESEAEGDEGDEGEGETLTASAAPARRRKPTAASLAADAPATPAPPATPTEMAQQFTSVAGVSGRAPGEPFADMGELGMALVARYKDIAGGGTEKLAVAQVEGRFAEHADLTAGATLTPIDPSMPETLTAGFDCVPREPIYGPLGCLSSLARPVANSLPNMKAPRGGYSVYPSPKLADVANADDDGDGTGIWTRANDGDDEAVKAECAVIPCGTPENYDLYGVYRCVTVKYLHNLTHPELVAAYLNKSGALWARLADSSLLDAMLASNNAVDVTEDLTGDAPLGANFRLLDFLVHAVGVYREQERYDSVEMEAWLPRHVQVLLIRDWLARTHADVRNPRDMLISVADLNSALAEAGAMVHWTLDVASSWESIGTQGAGALEAIPTTIDGLLAPRGNFRRLDEGTLTVGVTNRVPWDKDDMKRNQFTMFWETFEGIIDMGCPSWSFNIGPVCATGLSYGPLDSAEVTCEAAGS